MSVKLGILHRSYKKICPAASVGQHMYRVCQILQMEPQAGLETEHKRLLGADALGLRTVEVV